VLFGGDGVQEFQQLVDVQRFGQEGPRALVEEVVNR
jgi:hypothetical protein